MLGGWQPSTGVVSRARANVNVRPGSLRLDAVHPAVPRELRQREAVDVRTIDDHLDPHDTVDAGDDALAETAGRCGPRDRLATLVGNDGHCDVCTINRRSCGYHRQRGERDEGEPHFARQHRVGRNSRGP